MEEGQASRQYCLDRVGETIEGPRRKAVCLRSPQLGEGEGQATLNPRNSPKDIRWLRLSEGVAVG